MNAKTTSKKPAAPRKPRANKNAAPSAAATAPAVAVADSASLPVQTASIPAAAPTAQISVQTTHVAKSSTKKGEYHSLFVTNLGEKCSEVAKPARVPFKQIALLGVFGVDKRYAVKTGNRSYVFPGENVAKKAGKDLMVTPFDAQLSVDGISDFVVAPPKPSELAKIEKAGKRAAKKAEKKTKKSLVKPNGAKPVLTPQAAFHPHPPVGGAAQ